MPSEPGPASSDERVAVVGSGVSGLVAAHGLHPRYDVTLFEADDRLGGHANTVRMSVDGAPLDVDTGFLVYNERNYPGFVALLNELGVATKPSEMSFSVHDERSGLQWRGTSLDSVLAQRRRAVDPRFVRMLADVVRFNRTARRLAAADAHVDVDLTVEDVLTDGRYSRWLREWYLVPMGAAIWSADPSTFTRFPAAVLARFLDNHGLLRLGDVPQWRTVVGGSKRYVEAIASSLAGRVRLSTPVHKVVRRTDGVELVTERGIETFDRVVLATHSDQALRLLADPSDTERSILGAIRYQPNVATLHTDASLLPSNRRARAAWNYHVGVVDELGSRASLTYHLNALQGLDTDVDVCVTLNRPHAPDPSTVVEHIEYAHPVFDAAAVRAQRRFDEIDGRGGVHYCGAYWRYGFHEDGVQSALEVRRRLGARS